MLADTYTSLLLGGEATLLEQFGRSGPGMAIALHSLTRLQVNKFWICTGTLPDEVRRAAFSTDSEPGDPTAPWDRIGLPIDGSAMQFRTLGHADYWVAQTRLSGILVGIEAKAWPLEQTGLVTIDDPSPYVTGSEIIAQRGRNWYAQ